ncbi:MAG: M23 family metallopeptidase [Bacteroidales bacterium]
MDENFHEKLSLRLSRLNVLLSFALGCFTVVGITFILLVFTPIRQIIPGYIRNDVVETAYQNRMSIDSLEQIVDAQRLMLQTIRLAISGEIPLSDAEVIKDSLKDYSNIEYRISMADSLLRKEVENSDQYAVVASKVESRNSKNASFSDNILFYPPLQGIVIRDFDHKNKHFGTDLEGVSNDVIKSTLDGNVIFTDWSPDWGYIIIIQHENNLISVYSSNSALLKKKGDFIKAGEAIAIIGTSSEHPHIPCLHFELWSNGTPVNPKDYITL